MSPSAPCLDFYFFIGSTYSSLSVRRADALAKARGVVLAWKPFSVRTLMREQANTPFAGKPQKMAYMWRDIERRSQRFGLPFSGPAPYPIDKEELANHVATLASMEGWCREFVQAAYAMWFLQKRDPGDMAALREILVTLGRDADRCIARASAGDVAALYRERTDDARALGVFGSPTFVAGREIFWGDDRLEDAIDWCLDSAA